MNPQSDCAAVLACWNEAPTIAQLVKSLLPELANVYVVDDGSSDETALVAAKAGAEVLRHPRNRGKGAALRTGLAAAFDDGFSWCLTLDGDGQHAPEDLGGFLECAERTGAQLVVGNRMGEAGAMPFLRQTVNRWMSGRLSKLTGSALPDSQCGFRLLDLRVWQSLRLNCEHFEVESELLLEYLRAGCRVEFVPIRVIYGQRQYSRIRPLQDTLRWLRWWWQARQRATNGRRDPKGITEDSPAQSVRD